MGPQANCLNLRPKFFAFFSALYDIVPLFNCLSISVPAITCTGVLLMFRLYAFCLPVRHVTGLSQSNPKYLLFSKKTEQKDKLLLRSRIT